MRVTTLFSAASHININLPIPNFDGECGKVIAPTGEASTAAHVVTPSVPVTSQHAIAHPSARQRIAHVWTLVVGRVHATIV
jgi:hypothetical protein